VLDAAQTLAAQSGIPTSNLTLINRQDTYAHNDPAAASPQNDFIDNLIPFLDKLAKPGLGPCNAPGKLAAHRPDRTHGGTIRDAHGSVLAPRRR
jgi:hypothetical protein